MKKYFVVILLFSTSAFAQEIFEPKNRLTEDGIEVTRHVWKASWIAHPTASQADYGVFLFRNNVQLSSVPAELLIYVSADNRYKLFVNGKYVSNGPARGDEFNWNYETVDIAPFLKVGKNIIAAEVINYGDNKPYAQHSFKTGFLLQAKDSAYDKLNTGTGQWRVTQNKAYNPIAITFAMVNGFYSAGPGDSVNAKLFPWKWKELNL